MLLDEKNCATNFCECGVGAKINFAAIYLTMDYKLCILFFFLILSLLTIER